MLRMCDFHHITHRGHLIEVFKRSQVRYEYSMRIARIGFLVFLVVMVGVPVWWYTKNIFSPETTLLQGGLYLDPSGQTRKADLRIKAGRILELGGLSPLKGEKVVDASSYLILPGFIEPGHDPKFDPTLAIQAGITSVIVPERRTFQNAVEKKSAVNVAWLLDYFELENGVINSSPGAEVSPQAMRTALAKQLQLGALGVYLDARQGITPSLKESLTGIAEELQRRNGLLSIRLQGGTKNLWDDLEIVLKIAETTKVPLHIADLQLATEKVWNRANHLVARLNKARALSGPITFDMNPLLPLQPSDLQTFIEDPQALISTGWALEEQTLETPPETVMAPTVEVERLASKRSAMSAHTFGLKERGTLEPGNFADLVLVKQGEPRELLGDLSKLPDSISQVWVNGKKVFEGKIKPISAGRPLYPSRSAGLSE